MVSDERVHGRQGHTLARAQGGPGGQQGGQGQAGGHHLR